MNARTIAFVACRLFAGYLLLTNVLGFLAQTVILTITGNLQSVTAFAVLTVLYAVAAVILWVGAGWIADRLPGSFSETKDTQLNISHWALFCVSGVGALFIFAGTRSIGGLLKTRFSASYNQMDVSGFFPYLVIYALLLLVAGLFMLSSARVIVRKLSELQSWAAKPLISEDDQ